jgi:hypothetical protein
MGRKIADQSGTADMLRRAACQSVAGLQPLWHNPCVKRCHSLVAPHRDDCVPIAGIVLDTSAIWLVPTAPHGRSFPR